jgi:sialic acid synthase
VGLRKLVRDLQRVRSALGDGTKKVYPSEQGPILKMSKKLVAARDLPTGHVLGPEDVALKSPGDGLPPHMLDVVVGRTLLRPLKADDPIQLAALGQGEAA